MNVHRTAPGPPGHTQGERATPEPALLLEGSSLADAETLASLEWLATDGRGGYAAGTVATWPTRRYHGHLVVPLAPTGRRYVLLGHLEERVEIEGAGSFLLSLLHAADGAPGDRAATLERFALRPWPAWVLRAGGHRVEREVLLARGESCALVRWRHVAGDAPLRLAVAPFLPCREADALTFANDAADPRAVRHAPAWAGADALCLSVRPYDALPAVWLAWQGPALRWSGAPRWVRGVDLAVDRARGYDGQEDRLTPGTLECVLAPGESLLLAAEPAEPGCAPAEAWEAAVRAAEGLRARAGRGRHGARARAWRAADDFLYTAPAAGSPAGRAGVLAGFPWFGEWGRDVFVSLPGLTLARGDRAGCEAVLAGALPYLRDGLLPNVYGPTPEESHYGSADAALWFARAARLLREAGGSRAFLLERLLPALRAVHAGYEGGTALGIHGDGSGLVLAGTPALNPTWMDAQTSAGPVTPRDGCPVELAALWILLLDELAALERLAGDAEAARAWDGRRARADDAFRERFWLADDGRLADGWKEGVQDRAVRPNMVLAAALGSTPLARAERLSVVERAEAELLTPRGLRTLSPRDPAYRGRYRGGPEERNAAYHQGTVWPWLLGSYVEACLRARGAGTGEVARLAALLDGLDQELDRAGLDHVSEVFDGDPPHAPGGCFAQAWNTAELLRARALLAAPPPRDGR